MSAKSGGEKRPTSATRSGRGSVAEEKPPSPQQEEQLADAEQADLDVEPELTDRPPSGAQDPTQEDFTGRDFKS